jgi:molybdenum cofactor cytidylyltransferase
VIAAVVLAAGAGSRFGGTKQVAVLEGKPLVRHAVDAAHAAGIQDVVVVVGHDADAVAAAAGDGARIVRNPRWRAGQSTSLIAGIDALGEDVDAAVVLLADQPGIAAEHVKALLDAAASVREPIVRMRFTDAPGPTSLGREVWGEVRRLRGDLGARDLIERRPDLVFELASPTSAPPDVDTPADLERASARPGPDAGHEKPPSL